ncbi:hypothetical protein SAY87_014054 [Trapa incisa]|uniref:Uncharacterized protein n=1 Tax=Trapa incisa TaxID=236973 RepID=A0AAN7GV02_9MYRT|nr:hypothetical protein SAY87_014054 [Trapa incisa]
MDGQTVAERLHSGSRLIFVNGGRLLHTPGGGTRDFPVVLELSQYVPSPSDPRHILCVMLHPSWLDIGMEASSGSCSFSSRDLRAEEENCEAKT